jgi:hypothetical protein
LIKLLYPHWNCVNKWYEKDQKKIDELDQECFEDPDAGCLIF